MSEQILAAVVAAAVSATVSLVVALAQLRQGRITQRNQVQQDISARYDKMVDYRLQHPEVLALARRWQNGCFSAIYTQATEEEKRWAIYYGYVELCISYCNTILYAKSRGLLDPDIYKSYHEPLIRLILAEHYPILSVIIRPGGYVARYLLEYVDTLRKKGWDWEAAHRKLAA